MNNHQPEISFVCIALLFIMGLAIQPRIKGLYEIAGVPDLTQGLYKVYKVTDPFK